jgi:preprotein translocase subunit YajC
MDTYIAPGTLLFLLQQDGGGGSITGLFVPMILMVGIFYFLIFRPQQKKQRQAKNEREQLLSSLKSGDKIITSGGIYGTIIAVREDNIQLNIAPSVSIKIQRSAIAGTQSPESKEVEASKS